MTGLKVTTGGGAVPATEHFAIDVGPAIYRSILKGALLLGRHIAENVERFKVTPGTKRLSRSFLVPVPSSAWSFLLGADSPIYAAIHEYGGRIKAKRAEYLHFMTPDGEWHTVKEVEIREKRYARDALDTFDHEQAMSSILAAELTSAFKAT
jgi:hypothetical protein